jgi:Transglycosylase-like domain
MQFPLSLRNLSAGVALAAVFAAVLAAGGARAAQHVRPAEAPASIPALRAIADHYRTVTWSYQRASRVGTTPTSFSYRRSADRDFLRWTIDRWTRRAYVAREQALARIHRKLDVTLPPAPGLRASLHRRLSYSRTLTVRLRRIYPGKVSPTFVAARARTDRATLRLWQARSASAALAVVRHARVQREPALAAWLARAFLCIHRYEGAWNANTGNGYYGGLQMDWGFMRAYGGEFLSRWGTADNWPPSAQLQAAARAHQSGRGFTPWPHTARACGLL